MFTDFLNQYLAAQGVPLSQGSGINISPMNVPQNEFKGPDLAGKSPVAPSQPLAPPQMSQGGPIGHNQQSGPPMPPGAGGPPDIMGMLKGMPQEVGGAMQGISNIAQNPSGALNMLSGAIGQGFQAAGLPNPGDMLQQMGAPPMPSFGQGANNLGAPPTPPGPSMQANANANAQGLPNATGSGMDGFLNSLSTQESGGRYDAMGPRTKYGRALGKYQILPENVRAWSKQYLGTEMNPQEFLKNPQAQEQIARAHIGALYNQYGNYGDVASVWHSGKPMSQSQHSYDHAAGISTPDYVKSVTGRLPQQDNATMAPPMAPPINSPIAPSVQPQQPQQPFSNGPQSGLGGLVGDIGSTLGSLFGGGF